MDADKACQRSVPTTHTFQRQVVQGQEGIGAVLVLAGIPGPCQLRGPCPFSCEPWREAGVSAFPAGRHRPHSPPAVRNLVQGLVDQSMQVLHLAAVDAGSALDEEGSCGMPPVLSASCSSRGYCLLSAVARVRWGTFCKV